MAERYPLYIGEDGEIYEFSPLPTAVVVAEPTLQQSTDQPPVDIQK